MPLSTNHLTLLFDLGFEEVGTWVLASAALQYTLRQHHRARNILYAFVVDQEVMYLGKSTRTLATRMYGYQKPGPTQRTNIANHDRLLELVKLQKVVRILVFLSPETLFYRGIPINLAAGLEDVLIERIRPAWNWVGTRDTR